MARVEVSAGIHKKIKAYAALNGLKIPEAYAKLLKIALEGAER